MLFLPELLLLATGLIFFFLSLGSFSASTLRMVAIVMSLVVTTGAALALCQQGNLFFNSYSVDFFSQVFKLLIALTTVAVVYIGGKLPGIIRKNQAEYYIFLFMSVLGLMMLVSSVELLAIFIALELSSFTVYIMVPLRTGQSKQQYEAAIKYLLFGVMATGFMLFGMSYIFGLTGSTYLSTIITKLPELYSQPAGVAALVMVMTGFFYKLGIFPFHFWVPDVYQGSSNETTTFIATIPKIGAVALLFRLVTLISGEGESIAQLLLFLSLASMFYGNLSALVQKDLKRMLGYSGIAHAGFILFGMLTLSLTGYSNSFYYIVGYVIMNLSCFLVICSVAGNAENLRIEDLKGLNKRSPLLALTLLIGLFSLAGIPPFVGFTGKFMLLVGALQEGYLIAVILAAFNTAIAIYYYLNVVRISFCSAEEDTSVITLNTVTKTLCILFMLLIVVLGLTPSFILDSGSKAISLLM